VLKVSFDKETIRKLGGNHDDATAKRRAEQSASAIAKKMGASVDKFTRAVMGARGYIQAYCNAHGALNLSPQRIRAALRLASRLAGELHKFTAAHQRHSKGDVHDAEIAVSEHLAALCDQYAALAGQRAEHNGRPTSVRRKRYAEKKAREILNEYLPVAGTRPTTRPGRAVQAKDREKRRKLGRDIVSAILE
jgi:hypothetical protein